MYYYDSTDIADFARRKALPFVINAPDSWRNAGLPDRYWQLYRREAVLLRDFIQELRSGIATPLKPVLCAVRNQFYIQHPPAFDLSDEHAIERVGRGLLLKWSRGFVSYNLCYHNFHRKFIRRFDAGSPPTYTVTDHEVGDFIYDGAGSCLALDGETRYYHIFGLENLSSYTYMTNVKLTTPTGSTLRFGRMTGSPSMPNLTSITWDEIAPHTEVLFTVYASEDSDNHWEGTGLEYGLEIR